MFLTIKLYSCETKVFEIELTICIKINLALNTLSVLPARYDDDDKG